MMVPCPLRLVPCEEKILFLVIWLKHKTLCLYWPQEGRQYLVKHKMCWAKLLSESVVKHVNQPSELVLALHFMPCGCSISDVGSGLKLDILVHRTMPSQSEFCSVRSPAQTGTKFAVADPEKFVQTVLRQNRSDVYRCTQMT